MKTVAEKRVLIEWLDGKILERSPSVHRYIRCDQISLQGHVDAGIPEAD